MYDDKIPIDAFIGHCFQRPQVVKIISNWRIEPIKLQVVVSAYIREMGINFVAKHQKPLILETVVFCLKRSREIRVMVKKAESEENERRKSRHADI
jgi:hypothetical protein